MRIPESIYMKAMQEYANQEELDRKIDEEMDDVFDALIEHLNPKINDYWREAEFFINLGRKCIRQVREQQQDMQIVFRVFEELYPDALTELNLAIQKRVIIRNNARRELMKMKEQWRNEE